MIQVQTFTNQEEKAIQSFIAELQARYKDELHAVVLFGSKARGDSLADSDIDLLLVLDSDNWTTRNQISQIASRISLNFDLLIAAHVVSASNWQKMSEEPFSFYKNILREGITLLPSEA